MATQGAPASITGPNYEGLQVGNNPYSVYARADRPRTPPKPSSNIPFRRDDSFVERSDVLERIDKRCSRPAGRAALVGFGGFGKSQLAIEYAHRVRRTSPDTWIFWVHASNSARLEQAFGDIAERVGLCSQPGAAVDTIPAVYKWLSNEANGRWLMIVDNADDEITIKFQENGQSMSLASLLPQSDHGAVLITSRNADVARSLVGRPRDIIQIGAMSNSEAAELLRNKLGEKPSDGVTELVNALDYIPLAIVQAAAYINRLGQRMSIRKYLSQLKGVEGQRDLLEEAAPDMRRDGQALNSVLATWQLSFEYIRQQRPLAADLLSFMSFFNPQSIPEFMIRHYIDNKNEEEDNSLERQLNEANDGFEEDMALLRAFSLVNTEQRKDEFEMHRLVQLATRVWLQMVNKNRIWRQAFIQAMAQEFPNGEYANWPKCRALFPHVLPMVEQEDPNVRESDSWALLLNNTGWYAWRQGLFGQAEGMVSEALRIQKHILGSDKSSTLLSSGLLGSVLADLGKYSEAESMHRQTLATREKVLGVDHPDTLATMSNLALVLGRQGKYSDAESMHRQMLATRERVFGVDNPDILASRSDSLGALTSTGNQASELPPNEQDDSTSETFSTPWSDPVRSTNPSSLSHEAAADVGQVAESRSSMTFWNFKKPVVRPDTRDDDDVQSVNSIPDDIESLVESYSGAGNYRQAAVNYIVKMFTGDVELFALYQEATQLMDQSKFVRNHQRLLKYFFLNLRSEGHSPSQALAVEFLRVRSKRIQISSEIRNLFIPSNDTVQEKTIVMIQDEKDNLFLLDRFLHEMDSKAQPVPTSTAAGFADGNLGIQIPVLPQADTLREESDNRDDDDDISSSGSEEAFQDDDALSKLEATSEFLTSGRPFSLYKQSLREFLYPASRAASYQEHLQRNVVQTGSEQIFLNSSEAQRGDVTDAWPLEVRTGLTTQLIHNEECPEEELPRVERPKQLSDSIYLSSTPTRQGKPKLVTATWKCRCGVIITDQYTEFVEGAVQTYIAERALRHKDQANDQNTSPGTRRWFNSIQGVLKGISNQLTKSFVRRQMQSQESSESQVADDGSIESPPVSNPASCPKHLQLCVSLHLRYTQTSYTSHNLKIESDKCLYDLLRAQYTKLTGRWKRLLSLRQIRQIRFVKFRLRKNKLVTIEVHSKMEARIRESLPREHDDDYDFAPPEPEFLPPIGHNEMIHYFYKPCTGQNDDFHIRRFPGHKRYPVPFQPTEEEKHVWGIELVESESREWLYLTIPVFVVFFSSMVFGIIWTMVLHDIQGGFTVAGYILTSGLALLGSTQVLLENV